MGNELRKVTHSPDKDQGRKKKQNRKSQKQQGGYNTKGKTNLNETIYEHDEDIMCNESEEYINSNIPSLDHPLKCDINDYYIVTDKVLGMFVS